MKFVGRLGIFAVAVHFIGAAFVAYALFQVIANAEFRQGMPEWQFYALVIGCSLFAIVIPFNLLTYFRLYLEFGEMSLQYNAGLIRRSFSYDSITSVTRVTQTKKFNRFFRKFAILLGFNVYGEYEIDGKKKDFLLSVRCPDEFIAALEAQISK